MKTRKILCVFSLFFRVSFRARDVAERPVDVRFAMTGVERRPRTFEPRRDWKYKNNILMYPLAYQSARRCGMSSGHSFRNDRSGAETSNLRVRRDWKYKNNILMYPLAYQSARRCGMSSGHSFRNDRSGAETSNLRVPAGLENTKKMVSNRIPSFCVSFRARDGTRTRGLDLGKVALHQLSHSRKERVMGIEPTYPAWKAGVLPLNYTRRLFNCCCLVKTCL